MVKVAQKRESSQIQIEDVRCVTVQAKSVEVHVTCFDRGSVFVKACPTLIARARMQQLQQPEGRFVPDTILLGYQWAPQWVPARTPTVHWGPISGKAVGGPNTVLHSSTVQKHGKHGSGALAARALLTRVYCVMTGHRNEEPTELMHEDFQVHVDSDWVEDLLERKNTTGVIVRRGIEERVSTTSEKQRVQHLLGTNEYFHLFINTEMLMIAARTHVDHVGCTSMVFHSSGC